MNNISMSYEKYGIEKNILLGIRHTLNCYEHVITIMSSFEVGQK